MKASEAIAALMSEAQGYANAEAKNLSGLDIEPFRRASHPEEPFNFEIDNSVVSYIRGAKPDFVDELPGIAKRAVRRAILNDHERFVGIIVGYARSGEKFPAFIEGNAD